jgi:excisionase family DNA binding protein
MHGADELLGPSQAARVAGCSPQWIRELVRQERLPGIRTGIGTLVKRQDAERLAAERQSRRTEVGE